MKVASNAPYQAAHYLVFTSFSYASTVSPRFYVALCLKKPSVVVLAYNTQTPREEYLVPISSSSCIHSTMYV